MTVASMTGREAIIVTGGSRGIGAAIVEHLLRAGYVVGCLSRSGGMPAAVAAQDAVRDRCIAIATDMLDADAVSAALARVAAAAPITGIVNNAGVHEEGRSAQLTREAWQRMIDGNATSTLIGCQAAFLHLEKNGGLIVNIGSFYDRIGVKRSLAYCAAKAAIGAITRVLAAEWAGMGIRVVNVAPGYIETDLNREDMTAGPLRAFLEKRIPRKTPGTPDEIAVFVAGLFVMGSTFLTGETIYIDGGQGIQL
jgi:NAD(P)-dependent dehydrogenase (short-subunit alcohol dehydrogenase family)